MNREVKLNLGSGPSGIKNWLNIDWGILPLLSKFKWWRKCLVNFKILPKSYEVKWPEIKLADIRQGIPMKDNSVDFIYCSHVLEHFEKKETRKILIECKRVLKNNGTMRIVLPDLKLLMTNYQSADIFCEEFYGYPKNKANWKSFFIRGHEWMYDQKSFGELLNEVGFTNWTITKIGEGKCPDLDKLDLKIHERLSMYFEIEK